MSLYGKRRTSVPPIKRFIERVEKEQEAIKQEMELLLESIELCKLKLNYNQSFLESLKKDKEK